MPESTFALERAVVPGLAMQLGNLVLLIGPGLFELLSPHWTLEKVVVSESVLGL